jgi:hypothetical protein
MILITQIVVIVVALCILAIGLSSRTSSAGKAWKKVGLSLLVVAMITAVLLPDTINSLAHLVGVGRGADLLLYVLTLAFIAYALNNYLHQQTERDALYRLARRIAILEANTKYDIQKK